MQVVSGYRLPCPDGCPQAAHDIMMECWHESPAQRPTASDVAKKIRLLQSLHPADPDQDEDQLRIHKQSINVVGFGEHTSQTTLAKAASNATTTEGDNPQDRDAVLESASSSTTEIPVVAVAPVLHSLRNRSSRSFAEFDSVFNTIFPEVSARSDLPTQEVAVPPSESHSQTRHRPVTINRMSLNSLQLSATSHDVEFEV